MRRSQKEMMEHSEVKIKLLKLYLERYLNILAVCKHYGDIFIYDLFCGEGIYENNGKGSPIIILETLNNVYFSNKAKGNIPSKVECLFNDIKTEKIEKLKSEVDARNLFYPEMGRLFFSTKDFQEILPEVVKKLNKLKNEKAFIFIDPYGYKNLKFANIINLLESQKSEVLLFLPTQFMFRFEKNGSPECLIQFISELMPKEEWPKSETGLDFIEKLKEAFRRNLGETYFVDSFVISREKNQFFCLFFFTSHIYGFDRMLDAKWRIDGQEGRGWSKKYEHDLFSQIEKKANTFDLERNILKFLFSKRTNSEVYQFTLHNGHLPSHSVEILKRLQDEGRLIVLNKDGNPARKSSFYLNYTDYKNQPDRVNIQLKNV